MNNKAPEKIYFTSTENGTHYYTEGMPFERESIEYVRKDAFIEKATKWLMDNIQNYTDDGMGEHSFVLVQDLKEDFKNYIKEE